MNMNEILEDPKRIEANSLKREIINFRDDMLKPAKEIKQFTQKVKMSEILMK